MADPRFKTREELAAWAQKLARDAEGDLQAQLAAVDRIFRVTQKHASIMWVNLA